MYELTKKIGKVFTSKFVGTGPSFYEKKKNLPGRGLTKAEKHCCTESNLHTCYRLPRDSRYGSPCNPEVRTGVGFMDGSIGATWLMTSAGGKLDRGY
jgi:hypothetical protein